ncbi:MAG: winged helix-turn-helix transcriptional regulator [SAR324 cluster bacterium]|nr:winged helix-turn-helix transcriptional regulator [SAR324 cluster bacterium]MBL7034487.1 winged helix-turn-helix transcriptional regulator [SAR324 cluster bacterium]
MNQQHAIEAFSALAQDSRVEIYRMLVRCSPATMRAGEISTKLNIIPSTLSGHLAVLKRAGLLYSKRQQREILYSANISAMNKLISFMLQDCCNGQMGNCKQILELLDPKP